MAHCLILIKETCFGNWLHFCHQAKENKQLGPLDTASFDDSHLLEGYSVTSQVVPNTAKTLHSF
jgi:hypothetical protein